MPKRSSGVVVHDDTFHQGSAKRDTANGVAGLNSAGRIIAPGSQVQLTRDINNDIMIVDRISGESAIEMRRTGANTFALYMNTVAGGKRIQDSSMKDVVSGIVAQDASGNATVTGSQLLLTRTAGGVIDIVERTSGELAIRLIRKAANLFHPVINVASNSLTMAFLDTNGDLPHMRPKAASANLRHSHDAEILVPQLVYTKAKTMTFANGISGTLRIAFDINPYEAVANTMFAKVRKTVGGVTSDLGAEQSVVGGIIYVTKTQDINVGVLAPGDTIEIWAHNSAEPNGGVQNFRVSYDNAADTVLVQGVANS